MANIIEVTITATGPQGEDGADGVGVPAGGTAGQILSKIDGTDYNTQWATIIESGANANGNWVRYADGSQICWAYATASYVSAARLEITPTFPVSFISKPVAVATRDSGLLDARIFRSVISSFSGNTSVLVRLFATGTDTFISGDTVSVHYIATGRWK
jgi:hypothetical protein